MAQENQKKRGCLFIGSVMLLTIVLSVGITIWVLTQYVFPKRFEPVELTQQEQQTLDQKLKVFEGFDVSRNSNNEQAQGNQLTPEKYSELGADRTIELSERELNSMIAGNPELAQKIAIDLSENLASGKLLVRIPQDFPIMAGENLRITAGMELAFRDSKPTVILRGVSVMGVPIPNAWLGNLKNVDLVREFGGSDGFWKAFSDGVEHIEVNDGKLLIKLKE